MRVFRLFLVLPIVLIGVAIASFGLSSIVTLGGVLFDAIQWSIFWTCVINTMMLSTAFLVLVYTYGTLVIAFSIFDDDAAVVFSNGPMVDGVLRSGVLTLCFIVPFHTATENGSFAHQWAIWYETVTFGTEFWVSTLIFVSAWIFYFWKIKRQG